jgi:hypothetical protein
MTMHMYWLIGIIAFIAGIYAERTGLIPKT